MGDVRLTRGVGSEDRFSGFPDRSLIASAETGRSSVPRDSFVSAPSQSTTSQRISQEKEDGDQLTKALVVAGVAVAGAAAIAGGYFLLRKVNPEAVSGGIRGLIQGIATLRPGIAAPFLNGLAGVSAISAALLIRQLVSDQETDDRSGVTAYRFRTENSLSTQPILFSERPIESLPNTRVVPLAPQQEKKGVLPQVFSTSRSLQGPAGLSGVSISGVETDSDGRRQASLAGRMGGTTELLFGRDGLKGDPFFRDSRPVATWVIALPRNSGGADASLKQSSQVQGTTNRDAQVSGRSSSVGPLRTNSIADSRVRFREERRGEVRVRERDPIADLMARAANSHLVLTSFRGEAAGYPDLSLPFSPLTTTVSPFVRRPETREGVPALTTHNVLLVTREERGPLASTQREGELVGRGGAGFGLKRRPVGFKGALKTDHALEDFSPAVLFSPPELTPRLVYSPLDLEAIRIPPGTDFSPQLEKVAQVTEYEFSLDELSEEQPEIPESEELADATQDEGDGSHRHQNGEEEAAEEDSVA